MKSDIPAYLGWFSREAAINPAGRMVGCPNPTNCNNVRNVNPTGGLNNNNAYNANGQWPRL
jgi:hypothetical protein